MPSARASPQASAGLQGSQRHHGYTVGGDVLGVVAHALDKAGAHALQIALEITEGVETEGHREILRRSGYGQSQGFLFSPPVGSVAIDDLAQRGQNSLPP